MGTKAISEKWSLYFIAHSWKLIELLWKSVYCSMSTHKAYTKLKMKPHGGSLFYATAVASNWLLCVFFCYFFSSLLLCSLYFYSFHGLYLYLLCGGTMYEFVYFESVRWKFVDPLVCIYIALRTYVPKRLSRWHLYNTYVYLLIL